MRLVTRPQIEKLLDPEKAMRAIEEGFCLYSQKKAVVPPVGCMQFEKPRGEVHIKYGYLIGDDYYVVKIASAFYENPSFGLASTQGVILIFDRKTGVLNTILHDEGYLTNVRTALVGAIAVKYLAPSPIERIGLVGTGMQARHLLQQLLHVTPCRSVLAYGSTPLNVPEYSIEKADSIEKLVKTCPLILTATPSSKPLLFGEWIQPGTLIVAIGADQEGKQELDRSVFAKAHLIVVDSRSQCFAFGDAAHAQPEDQKRALELGEVLASPPELQREAIVVVDSTGLAVQDIQIAKTILFT